MAEATQRLNAAPDKCHGRCYGAEAARDAWPAPQLAVRSDVSARPGYDSMGASEYEDEPEVLAAKVSLLAELIGRSRRCIVYSGAGLSTSAGIQDYATQAPESLSGAGGAASSFRSPMCAQPTAAHRALVALERAGKMHRWINQNHDGLPQKAGLPQEAINEIHGAWHAPDNPVIPMSGCLRDDLFDDVQQCEREADLVLALGTSLCGAPGSKPCIEATRPSSSTSERTPRCGSSAGVTMSSLCSPRRWVCRSPRSGQRAHTSCRMCLWADRRTTTSYLLCLMMLRGCWHGTVLLHLGTSGTARRWSSPAACTPGRWAKWTAPTGRATSSAASSASPSPAS
mmetsp:Transcript_166870/g.535634  ORF Transcript_166870/g.535634 Transcript_166870/m.535634 type:complete len:341 (-) Transcript_166870:175-1197(-)